MQFRRFLPAMSVLAIRTARRFAVRDSVTLRDAGGRCISGLMIELSAEGCRISGLNSTDFAIEDAVTLIGSCGRELPGLVRWAHSGKLGLRFDEALHQMDLAAIVASAHPLHPLNTAATSAPRYGT